LEFGNKVLGLKEEHLRATPAFVFHSQEDPEDMKLLFQARVLAFATSTWTTHVSHLKEFLDFCGLRNYSPLECTPPIINLFMLQMAQKGKSYGFIERFTSALSFLYRFLLINNLIEKEVLDIKKFMEKVCPHKNNKKDALGSSEVRKIWDSIDQKYGNVQNLNRNELRTFVMAVFQHKTFCRFSDLTVIKLEDIIHDVDYFKIKICCLKTDKGGKGQFVFIPKSSSPVRDPHMLMCLYLHSMGFDEVPDGEALYLFPPVK
jgi:site-specific recombinase XerD